MRNPNAPRGTFDPCPADLDPRSLWARHCGSAAQGQKSNLTRIDCSTWNNRRTPFPDRTGSDGYVPRGAFLYATSRFGLGQFHGRTVPRRAGLAELQEITLPGRPPIVDLRFAIGWAAGFSAWANLGKSADQQNALHAARQSDWLVPGHVLTSRSLDRRQRTKRGHHHQPTARNKK